MRLRLLPWLAVLCLTAVPSVARPAPAPAGDAKNKPGVVVRVQSLDDLLANARYLAGFFGAEEQVKQFEALIKARIGEKGLDGFDPKRPLGLYGEIGPNGIDSLIVVVLPIADEKAVLGLLENLNLKAEKGKDDVYSLNLEQPPLPIYFRFANKHAYVTLLNPAAIAKDKLLDPTQLLAGNANSVLSAHISIDKIPENLKNDAIGQIELNLANVKGQKGPGETEAQHKFKGEVIDEVSRQLVSLLKDGGDLALDFSIDRKKNDLSLEISLSGKEKSKLAANIAEWGKLKSTVAGLISKDSAASGVLHFSLPDGVRKSLVQVAEEAFLKQLDKEKDKAKRELATKVYKALEPTLKAGELDLALDLRGPSDKKRYTLVAGLKVQEGEAMEKVARDLLREMPAEVKNLVKLDVDKVGSVKIHQIDLGKFLPEEVRQVFGESPLYVAIRPDAVFAAFGDQGLSSIKEAVTVQPKVAAPLQLDVSVARLAALFGQKEPGVLQAAEQAFGQERNSDKVRLILEGGKTLRLRLEGKAQVLKFIGLLVSG
jgi:hypothetical protein